MLRVFWETAERRQPARRLPRRRDPSDGQRQDVAADLGFSETVFVDDAEAARSGSSRPDTEVPFAGHPVVGTAGSWRVSTAGCGAPPAGGRGAGAPARASWTFAAGRPEWAPEWEFVELGSPAEVDALQGHRRAMTRWASGRGSTRAPARSAERVFAQPYGIAEDEATGSAAVVARIATWPANSTSARAAARGFSPGRCTTGWSRSGDGWSWTRCGNTAL